MTSIADFNRGGLRISTRFGLGMAVNISPPDGSWGAGWLNIRTGELRDRQDAGLLYSAGDDALKFRTSPLSRKAGRLVYGDLFVAVAGDRGLHMYVGEDLPWAISMTDGTAIIYDRLDLVYPCTLAPLANRLTGLVHSELMAMEEIWC